MTAVVETGSVQNVFKRVYIDNVKNQLPEFAQLQAAWQFDSANKTGDRYERAVMLRYPNGATYAGGATRRTAYSYNDPRAGATQPAYASTSEYTLREQIAYGVMSDAATSEQAFKNAFDVIVMGMKEAARFHLETCLLYGGTSLGAIDSVAGGGTTGTAVITKASWAAALWAAQEGAELDAYDPTLVTKRNTNGPIQLTSVDADTRTLSLTYAAAGDRTSTVAGDVFVPVGANGNWFAGLDSLITTSVAGTTTLGIAPSTYGMWRSNTFAAGGALTFAKVAQAASKIASRGGLGPLKVRVSSWTWTDVMNDQASLRRYTAERGGEFENGADELVYHGPNGGSLSFVQHPLVKAGEAFITNDEDFRRVGSSEPTFQLPGRNGAENPMFLLELPSSAGFEIRHWWDQVLFSDRLARSAKITGIVNASL